VVISCAQVASLGDHNCLNPASPPPASRVSRFLNVWNRPKDLSTKARAASNLQGSSTGHTLLSNGLLLPLDAPSLFPQGERPGARRAHNTPPVFFVRILSKNTQEILGQQHSIPRVPEQFRMI
jgi:hypothetical protein